MMKRIWLVTKHHFLQEATKKSFLIILFLLPLFMALTIGLGYLASRLDHKPVALGYVDMAGLIQKSLPPPEGESFELVAYEDRGAARAALEGGAIDAYYVIPANYGLTGQATLYYGDEPPAYRARAYFWDTARANLMAGQSVDLTGLVVDGAEVTVRALDSRRTFPADGPNPGHLVPLVAAAILSFLIVTTASYMAEVVVAEKANRTIEIVVTSISSTKLMMGKILGALLIAAMQLSVWLSCLAAALWLGANVLGWTWLENPQVIWRDVLLLVLVGIPTYIFISALITMIGSTMNETYDAQQIGGLSMLIMFLPVYLSVPIIKDPHGTVALVFSVLPGPSVMTLALRSLFTEVPAVHFMLASATVTAGAVLALWLAGQAFRRSMLRTGRRLRLREIFEIRNKK